MNQSDVRRRNLLTIFCLLGSANYLLFPRSALAQAVDPVEAVPVAAPQEGEPKRADPDPSRGIEVLKKQLEDKERELEQLQGRLREATVKSGGLPDDLNAVVRDVSIANGEVALYVTTKQPVTLQATLIENDTIAVGAPIGAEYDNRWKFGFDHYIKLGGLGLNRKYSINLAARPISGARFSKIDTRQIGDNDQLTISPRAQWPRAPSLSEFSAEPLSTSSILLKFKVSEKSLVVFKCYFRSSPDAPQPSECGTQPARLLDRNGLPIDGATVFDAGAIREFEFPNLRDQVDYWFAAEVISASNGLITPLPLSEASPKVRTKPRFPFDFDGPVRIIVNPATGVDLEWSAKQGTVIAAKLNIAVGKDRQLTKEVAPDQIKDGKSVIAKINHDDLLTFAKEASEKKQAPVITVSMTADTKREDWVTREFSVTMAIPPRDVENRLTEEQRQSIRAISAAVDQRTSGRWTKPLIQAALAFFAM